MSLGLVFNSCKRYFDTHFPRLISDIQKYNKYNIPVLFVAGGYEEESIETPYENITVVKVKYQAFDVAALYYIGSNQYRINEITHWFLLHDTVRFTQLFFDRFLEYGQCINESPVRLYWNACMNIGIYPTKYLIGVLSTIETQLFYDESKILQMKEQAILFEDYLFGDKPIVITRVKTQTTEIKIINDKEIEITLNHFSEIGLIKYQQNIPKNNGKWSYENYSITNA